MSDTEARAVVGDVIQLRPEYSLGALIMTAHEVHDWGVQAYSILPTREEFWLRVKHTDYVRIGPAAWTMGT